MKLVLTAFMFLLFSLSCYSQDNCKSFKTGKFQNIENGIVKSIVERDEEYQFESFGNKEIKLKITWLNECTYKLKLIWGNDAFWNGRPKEMSTPDLIVQITETNGREYSQEAKSEGEDFIYKSKLVKVE